MSIAYRSQPEHQQTLDFLHGWWFTILVDSQATESTLTVNRYDVPRHEARSFHPHTRADEERGG